MMMELIEAIRKQKGGGSPGPDDIQWSIIKKIENILSDKLKALTFEILDGAQLPDSWRYSTTTLIPKEGKINTTLQIIVLLFF